MHNLSIYNTTCLFHFAMEALAPHQVGLNIIYLMNLPININKTPLSQYFNALT